MSAGFYKRRRGILEHLESGRISLLDLAVHDYLNLKANLVIGNGFSIPAGVCITSARAIHATCPSQISERAVQRSLEHLRKIGWIKTWGIRGKRGNYPILVCRSSVHDLSGNEYRVSGDATTDWRSPVFIAVADLSSLPSEADANLSTDREVRVESREQTTPRASAATAAAILESETKRTAFDDFWERWPRKADRPCAARAWLKVPISEYPAVMAGLDKFITCEQWNRGVIPHASTWLNHKRWQDEDIPPFSIKGGTNGKPTATELALRNARALGLDGTPN